MRYQRDEADNNDQQNRELPHGHGSDHELFAPADQRFGYARYDGSKDQHRNTVADAVFGNPLAKPHQKRGAGGGADADRGVSPEARIHQVLITETDEDTDGLNHRKSNADVAGDLFNLLAAILFLIHALQSGNRNGEQLHDNGSVDVR
ncbi:hypothetical protein SDC9_148122 [bioreactor metagenome]|uniref:Uncharacterized protein n=1 Tax=bioreactor metagenome TaxID=1076179 RepID=A0A645EJN1_9ZZZZ